MFHVTIAVLLSFGFFLLIFITSSMHLPLLPLLLFHSAPPLISCRHSSLSLSHPHCLPLPCALLGLPPRVVFSPPPPFLVLPFFGVGLCHTCLGGFPTPPLLFATRRRLSLHYFCLPAASGSFLSSLSPYLVSSLVSFNLPVPAPSLSLSGSHLWSPSSSYEFALFRGLGVGGSLAFGGVPSTPFPIRDCHISQFCFVFFMSFSQCAFFYYSFFFSLDSPSLPFVFGAAHLYFFVRCGGVVCLFGLFLALLLFPTSIPFLGLLLVSAGFFVCVLLCLFFLRALPVMSLG